MFQVGTVQFAQLPVADDAIRVKKHAKWQRAGVISELSRQIEPVGTGHGDRIVHRRVLQESPDGIGLIDREPEDIQSGFADLLVEVVN